jgi:RecJ-like exonuclease
MAVWCSHCDGTGVVKGFMLLAQWVNRDNQTEVVTVPDRPCLYCFGKGVLFARDEAELKPAQRGERMP